MAPRSTAWWRTKEWRQTTSDGSGTPSWTGGPLDTTLSRTVQSEGRLANGRLRDEALRSTEYAARTKIREDNHGYVRTKPRISCVACVVGMVALCGFILTICIN